MPLQYKQMLDIQTQAQADMEFMKKKETYKGPSQNIEEILCHFYKLQKQKLKSLGMFDINLFAVRYHYKKVMIRTVQRMKDHAFKRSNVARQYALVKLKKICYENMKQCSYYRVKSKRVKNKMDEIYSLFQSKRVFNAWKFVHKSHAKIYTIGEKKTHQQFCVKYSDFCKCVRCLRQKNNFDAIGPQNQQNLQKYTQYQYDLTRNNQNMNNSINTTKCVPFSQLYIGKSEPDISLIKNQTEKHLEQFGSFGVNEKSLSKV